MKPFLIILLLTCVTMLPVIGEESLYCHWEMAQFNAEKAPSGRHYAPDRTVDILHVALDVKPDFEKRTVAGKVTLRFEPLIKPVSELRLDAVDLRIESVESSSPLAGHDVDEDSLLIRWVDPLAAGVDVTVTVTYQAEPKQGLYFRTPAMGYDPQDTHLWTQGEPSEARHWYPCFDYPNEKFTSEITCHVPKGMTVLSNGRKVSEEKEGDLVAVRWQQEQPHANYLMALVAGHVKGIEDRYKEVPLAFYTPASQIEQAETSFRDTKDMMGFFEEETGVPYPWVKYYQVCVDDFTAGGMENTSLTILTDRTLFTEATENIRTSQGLIAHELAHQWFGDLVTCKDWGHLWLNEGFATYYEALYDGHKNGQEALLLRMHQNAQGIFERPNDTNAIVRRTYGQPEEQFSYLAYPKGAWILHMLRSQLGPDLFRDCIKTYVERHRFGSVVTEDLREVIEELSGQSFDQFFDQWVYHAHYPELKVRYSWDGKSRLAKLHIEQMQKLSDQVLLFQFPLLLRFDVEGQPVDHPITISKQSETFYFPLTAAPKQVRVDPEYTLLMKLDFEPPRAMIEAQLDDSKDSIGRLRAVALLEQSKDQKAVARLKQTLNEDSFYAVRQAASQALRRIHTDEALQALLESGNQPDARVRRQVVNDLSRFYRESVHQRLRQTLKEEKNPDILAEAIEGLGAYTADDTHDLLVRQLKSDSYRNILADAAVKAIRAQASPSYAKALQTTLDRRNFTSRGLAAGLSTLAYLVRDEENKNAVREFLLARINSPKREVQLAAIGALGTLGDRGALGALETFSGAADDSPQRKAADRALRQIREQNKPDAELGKLRDEVLDMQKENRKLREELDELKGQFKAFSGSAEKKEPVSEK